jgi:Mannosylglycerate hydrolase MGH1-like glycoside hydrolase domain
MWSLVYCLCRERSELTCIGRYILMWEGAQEHAAGMATTLFTNNETNVQRLFDYPNATPYVKDGINDAIVQGAIGVVNPEQTGTKAAVHYTFEVPAGSAVTVRLRLTASEGDGAGAFDDFDELFAARISEADEFYAALQPSTLSDDERLVQRQAFAGMLWSKQFFHYDVAEWLRGDSAHPPPPQIRHKGRNREWYHLSAHHVISMPDKWEYPWFAAWDLAFHCVTLALVDLDFAKEQLLLMCREWFQHPNGQLAAYEWAFGDVNPPVLAWAAVKVYDLEYQQRGKGDRSFLHKMFQKLALNFTWWVNRKDQQGNNLFGGGFLGLDNIGIFDRSAPLPTGGYIEQSDGTSWMAMFCIYMIDMALELSKEDAAYEDIFLKYVYHFMYITSAMQNIGEDHISLWDQQDQFFYNVLRFPSHEGLSLKVRSMVGLIPAYAVLTFEDRVLRNWAEFYQRIQWFVQRRPELAQVLMRMLHRGKDNRFMLSFCREEQLLPMSRYLLDESEFLSPYGVRALSCYHAQHPYTLTVHGVEYRVEYMPAESNSGMFGGNSNWRGPIWMPVNYLLIESLRRYYLYYGDEVTLECPTGSGRYLTLDKVADELSQRLIHIFTRDEHGRRAVFGDVEYFQDDPHWRDYVLFYEYFHGDTGRGVGASHQTGWTGLVASLIQEQGERRQQPELKPLSVAHQ